MEAGTAVHDRARDKWRRRPVVPFVAPVLILELLQDGLVEDFYEARVLRRHASLVEYHRYRVVVADKAFMAHGHLPAHLSVLHEEARARLLVIEQALIEHHLRMVQLARQA